MHIRSSSSRTPGLRLALVATLLAVPPLGTSPLAAQSFSPDAFGDYVAQAFTDWDAVGLAVAVVKEGELVFARGYGELELGSGQLVDAETRFSIGSTTKAMTAGAITNIRMLKEWAVNEVSCLE